MKTALLSLNRRTHTYIFTLMVATLCMLSCKKDSMVSNLVVTGESKLKLINANVSAPVDFFMDEVKITNQPLALGESTGYLRVSSGTRTISTSSANYLPSPLVLVKSFAYTAFYVEDRTGKAEVLTFEDNLGSTEAGKARIRFVNVSPYFTNSVNVNLTGNTLLVNSLAFKEASGYFSIDPKEELRVSVLGTTGVKVLAANALDEGGIYTIWFSGNSNATLTINKITNN